MNRATLLVLLGGLALTAALILVPGAEPSGPFVPPSDDEVLEQVPKSTPRPAGPLSPEDAAARARQLLDEARRSGGDARLLGRAQAMLSTWWDEPAPPAPIRRVRALLAQRFHDYEGALADLDALIALEPDEEAWLGRAAVLSALARYPEALVCCEQVATVAGTVCRARVMGLTGQATEGAALLSSVKPTGEEAARVLAARGELERWAGDGAKAQQTLGQALALDESDTATRQLLAQLWLEAGQPARAAQLFEGRVVNDGELVWWVLALEASQAKDAAARRAELDERVAANRLRGETLHLREEARYALTLEGDAQKALELATKNWAVQKGPEDARVLLEAALAAKKSEAAEPALQWLERTKFGEPRLRALAAQARTP